MRKERVPVGQLNGSFGELFEAGCIQTGAGTADTFEEARQSFREYFLRIYVDLMGNPCNGCPEFKGGSCPAYEQFHDGAQQSRVQGHARIQAATTAPGGKTVAQLAKELGVSKNEVRRRKTRGEL